jgi:hypothetical protein
MYDPNPDDATRLKVLRAAAACPVQAILVELVRNDAAEAKARADATEARKSLVQHLCDQIAGMQERINRLEDALDRGSARGTGKRSDSKDTGNEKRFHDYLFSISQ